MIKLRKYWLFSHTSETLSCKKLDYKRLECIVNETDLEPNTLKIFADGQSAFSCNYSELNCCESFDVIASYAYKNGYIAPHGFVIGNCKTSVQFRGRGLYQYGLYSTILQIRKKYTGPIYISARENNAASVAGITKSGFSTIYKFKRISNYYCEWIYKL